MGIAVAAAVAHGYSNIFITSPSPENLKTLFEFIFKGFDALVRSKWASTPTCDSPTDMRSLGIYGSCRLFYYPVHSVQGCRPCRHPQSASSDDPMDQATGCARFGTSRVASVRTSFCSSCASKAYLKFFFSVKLIWFSLRCAPITRTG